MPLRSKPPSHVPLSHVPPQKIPPRKIPSTNCPDRNMPPVKSPDSKRPPSHSHSNNAAPRLTVPGPNFFRICNSPGPKIETSLIVIHSLFCHYYRLPKWARRRRARAFSGDIGPGSYLHTINSLPGRPVADTIKGNVLRSV